MKSKKGFTLVEILIVVVILGILAAIVIPQFTNASDEAKTSSVASDLQTIRSQIELYKIQHNNNLPGTQQSVSFENAMTNKTDVDGTLNASGLYGAYLQSVPINPWNNKSTVETSGTVGDGSSGWNFNTTTGLFVADANS